jgi:SAM-dependent methyltransferase
LIGFHLREIAKNVLMHFPGASRLRKRLYARENDPGELLARQQTLVWPTYESVLLAGNSAVLTGGNILEIGPGPVLGNGVRFIARGAASYMALDRFDLYRTDDEAHRVYRSLVESLPPPERARCGTLIRSSGPGLFDSRLQFLQLTIEDASLRFPAGHFSLIVSYNVLEHVEDVPSALRSMRRLLRPGGLAIHRVDVSTHGDRSALHPLWQLTIPDWLWQAMYSVRSYPNRLRPADYALMARAAGLKELRRDATTCLEIAAVEAFRPHLLLRYRALPVEDLRILDFVWVLERPDDDG